MILLWLLAQNSTSMCTQSLLSHFLLQIWLQHVWLLSNVLLGTSVCCSFCNMKQQYVSQILGYTGEKCYRNFQNTEAAFGEQTPSNNTGSWVVTQDHKLCQLCSGYPLTDSTDENVYWGKELVLKNRTSLSVQLHMSEISF